MTKPVHNFKDSLQKGRVGEQKVIEYLESKGYHISKVLSAPEQKLYGYDFEVLKPDTGRVLHIEVKTEYAVETTGNIFYELMVGDRHGWCKTVPDDVYVMYYIPHLDKIIGIYGRNLKDINYEAFQTKNCYNANYIATGKVIPFRHFLTFCQELT